MSQNTLLPESRHQSLFSDFSHTPIHTTTSVTFFVPSKRPASDINTSEEIVRCEWGVVSILRCRLQFSPVMEAAARY